MCSLFQFLKLLFWDQQKQHNHNININKKITFLGFDSIKIYLVYFLHSKSLILMPFLYYQVSNSLYDVQSRWHNIVIPDLYVREDSKSVDLLQPFTNNYKHSTMMRGGSYIFFALEPNTNFEVRIQARNTYGWGRFSEIFLFSTSSAG